jgi:hypothetical protein
MTIKINNATSIDDTRRIFTPSITFADSTIQYSAAATSIPLGEVTVNKGVLLHTLNNPNAFSTSASDQFGYSVAISGNRAIVSAYLEDDAGGASSGKAYIFDVVTGALLHTLNNPTAFSTSAGDTFGDSVAISGNRAIVGARSEDDAGGTTSGKAYIFTFGTTQKLLLDHLMDNT